MILTPQANDILTKRYFKPGEGWLLLCKRVTDFLGTNDEEKDRFFSDMINGDFLPNTPCLANAGTENPQLSACFCIPLDDSIDSIFNAVKEMAVISKSGGGCGINVSRLRPEGFSVGKTLGVSSGPVSFMKVFNSAAQQLKQGGVRRAALLGMMQIDHPDIVKFIKCKQKDGDLNNFNISVAVTDCFMCDISNKDLCEELILCKFGEKEYFINKNTDSPELVKELVNAPGFDARQLKEKYYSNNEIWDLLCKNAWQHAEPGVIFIDTVKKANGPEIESPNPCITGDMHIAIPGDRTYSISELAELKVPFPVYCLNEKNEVLIRLMRNIGITRKDQPITKINLVGGYYIKVTEDHNFILFGQIEKTQAKDLKVGDCLIGITNFQGKVVKAAVESIEPTIREDVYNGIVDDFHNYFLVPYYRGGQTKRLFVNTCNCGEIPLEKYEACVLGSINVANFVEPGTVAKFDYVRLLQVVRNSVDFLNRVVDKGVFPLPQIREKVLANRKIGLGVMGWADALIKLGIRYGSEESLRLADELMGFVNRNAREYSDAKGYKNKTVTCIAPCGTISILSCCSSGIEPNFGWVTKQKREDFGTVKVFHPLAKSYLDRGEELPSYFVTGDDVPYEDHVKMQAAFQKHIENSISKTISMPKNCSFDDVANAYKLAFNSGCKGITVYRDGSRENQVITKEEKGIDIDVMRKELLAENKMYQAVLKQKFTSSDGVIFTTKENKEQCKKMVQEVFGGPKAMQEEDDDDNESIREYYLGEMGIPKERPRCLDGFTFKIKIDMGEGKIENAYIVVNVIDGVPYETFLQGNLREVSNEIAEYIDTTTRLVSLSMRNGVPLEEIVNQLFKVPCKHMYSIAHKIATILQEFIVDGTVSSADKCPECSGALTFSEGCKKCLICGFSRCAG